MAPAGAAYAVLFLQSSGNTGSVWFDDATATLVTGTFPALPGVPPTSGVGATLANPGFEQGANGAPAAWSPSAPSTATLTWASGTAHSGTYSAEISGSGSQASWSQLINTGALTAGEKLQATAWAEGSASTGSNVVSVAWFDAAGNYISNNTSPKLPPGASNWTELGVDAVAPAGAASAQLFVQSSNNTGSVWFDDTVASVVTGATFPALPAVPFTSGVGPTLANPGFERGANGAPAAWSPSAPSTGTLTWASGTAHSGTYSAQISGSGSQASWSELINTGALTTGEQLQATAWAEGSASTGSNVVSVAWFDAAGHYISNNTSPKLAAGNSGWAELSVNAVAPAGAAYAMLYVQSSNNTGSVWFDDVTAAAG